jgi:hypothetical protein
MPEGSKTCNITEKFLSNGVLPCSSDAPHQLCILKNTCYIHDELHFTFQFVVLSKYHDN